MNLPPVTQYLLRWTGAHGESRQILAGILQRFVLSLEGSTLLLLLQLPVGRVEVGFTTQKNANDFRVSRLVSATEEDADDAETKRSNTTKGRDLFPL